MMRTTETQTAAASRNAAAAVHANSLDSMTTAERAHLYARIARDNAKTARAAANRKPESTHLADMARETEKAAALADAAADAAGDPLRGIYTHEQNVEIARLACNQAFFFNLNSAENS